MTEFLPAPNQKFAILNSLRSADITQGRRQKRPDAENIAGRHPPKENLISLCSDAVIFNPDFLRRKSLVAGSPLLMMTEFDRNLRTSADSTMSFFAPGVKSERRAAWGVPLCAHDDGWLLWPSELRACQAGSQFARLALDAGVGTTKAGYRFSISTGAILSAGINPKMRE